MQTKEAIIGRHSSRSFTKKTITREAIEELADAGRRAPTARNIQPWEFVAVTKEAMLKDIAEVADTGKFINNCSCCIAVFCQDTKYYLEDGSAATENILLRAHDLELDSCWVAGDKKPYSDKIRQMLGAPENLKLVSLIAIGYSNEEPKVLEKRPLKEVLHWETF